MRKTTLFTLLTMLLLLVGHSYSWADDQLFYTLWTVSKTGVGVQNHTNYTQYFDDEHDGMVWNAPGNQKVSDNMTDRWRIGGKSLSGVDRTITAKTPMGSAIVRVVLNHFGTSRKEVTINSLTLTVASDDAFSSIVDEVELTPTIGQGTAGSVEFVPTVTYGTQWPTAAYYKLTINLSNTSTSNGGIDLASIQFYAPAGEVLVAKPVIAPAGGTFAEPQTVTITAADECSVYYTLDGTEPSQESTLYTAPFSVSETCTVKAIAYDQDDNASSIAAAEFTILVPISSIAALCAAAPAQGDETVLVNFNKWICTGVKGNNAYFTDGANGILLYQSTHGFAVGDELTGSAQLALTTYKGCAEIKGLKSSTEGVTVTKGSGAVPLTVAISDLEKDMQGCLLYFDGLTYNATEGAFIDDDDNQIIPYRTFVELPTLENGETYNVTGVAIWFDDGKVWEIAPRTKDEIVLVTSKAAPVSAWSVGESLSVDINDEAEAVFTTDSDGEVTYQSSNEEVATIDSEGNITILAKGTTVITANVAASNNFLSDSKSFTLTVTIEGYVDVTFAYDDADITGQGAQDVGAELTADRDGLLILYANKAYAKPNDTHIKIYGSKFETQNEEKVLTEPSYISLSVPNGCVITEIILTATSKDYIREWKDQDDNAVAIDGASAKWTGQLEEVVLTNQASSQARIKTIAVTYAIVDPVGIGKVDEKKVSAELIFNLAGQRLSKMQKGINIVGGKKILK